MADGSIRIETKLDTAALKRQVKELEKDLRDIQKEQAKTEEQIHKATEKHRADRDFDSQFPEEFSHRDEIDEKAAKELDPLVEKQDELNQKEQERLDKLREVTAELEKQEAIIEASKQVEAEVKAETSAAKVDSQARYNSELEKTVSKMAEIEAATARVSEETGIPQEEILDANSKYQRLLDTLRMLESKADEFGNAGESAGRRTSRAMESAAKSTKKVSSSTKNGIRILGRMVSGMTLAMLAVRAISAATREYMSTNSQLEGQMNTLKALWGQVLGPVIERVINLFIQAISVVNAFVQALTGINFVARANAAALKKQASAAGGGNSTAGFDEQTKLSGGGGSGGAVGTLPDGSTVDLSFLDPLLEAIRKFKDDISPLLDTLGKLFTWLWQEVLVPFGDWALNGVLPGFLNILGGAFLVLNDALLTIQPIAQWLWDNILAPIAAWTGGVIVDVLNAIGDWIHDHHETLGKVVAVLGVLIGLFVGVPAAVGKVSKALTALKPVFAALTSPVGLIVAAIVGLIALFVTLYDECEGFREGMDQVWQAVKDIFSAAVDFVKALFKGDWAGMDAAWARIKEAGKSLWEGLLKGLKAGWEWCKEKVSEIWKKIVTKFKEIFGIHSPSTVFAGFGKNMMEGLVNGIKNAISKVTSACNAIWSAIKSVFSSVGTWFKDTFSKAWQKVKDVFSAGGKIFDGIKDGIANTFKTIVNGLISGINRIIAVPFNTINKTLNTIRGISILGVTPFKNLWGYNPLSVPQIPKLALGGIVNRPGRGVPAIIGEAGKEAVLPLENHTEWMDILADKIGGNVTIPIYLDGKKIATYVVDIQKKKAFAMNGA